MGLILFKVYFNNRDYEEENQYGQTITRINYTLGLLYKILGDRDLAIDYLRAVEKKYAEHGDEMEV